MGEAEAARGFERTIRGLMDRVNAAVSDTYELLSNARFPAPMLDKRADRMLRLALSCPLGTQPALLGMGEAKLRLSAEVLAATRARVAASKARIADTQARVERGRRRMELPDRASG